MGGGGEEGRVSVDGRVDAEVLQVATAKVSSPGRSEGESHQGSTATVLRCVFTLAL